MARAIPFALLIQPFEGPADPLVLSHLVSRRVRSLLRSEPAAVANVTRFGGNYWHRAVHQFHDGRDETGAVADNSFIHDAILRIELRGTRERERFHSDIFAESE